MFDEITASHYLKRPAERLVLEGYRHWSDSMIKRSINSWVRGRTMFADKLGPDQGKRVFEALCHFTETLGLCAKCPLKTKPLGSTDLCSDEFFILGLISGLQYGDDAAVNLSLTALSCANRCDDVAFAAADFALSLKGNGLLLFPIPTSVLQDIKNGNFSPTTLH